MIPHSSDVVLLSCVVTLHFCLVVLHCCNVIPHFYLVNFYSLITKPFGDCSFSKANADFNCSFENLEKDRLIKHTP
ncbi:hypothetical protein ACFP3I_03740 [Chryseobacterium arachidis]|uniref:hypothetical protein n=1 Tax=Chryseobacterium arachidis TaxID=1416778 RepID=UPI0036121F00